ncbi:hypothetical protein [Nocardia tengchongensis]|uniref:hypothetical protein n=1 Tax=Nocardia tengchongensis TaxID=2055889 RepID=UPI0036C82CFF
MSQEEIDRIARKVMQNYWGKMGDGWIRSRVPGPARGYQTHPHDRLGHRRSSRREREARADMILDWVAGRLLDSVDGDCSRAELQVAMAADLQDIKYSTFNRDGSAQLREIPREIFQAFPDLRDLRFEDDLGTWFSLRIQVDPPENHRATFNFTVDPMWQPSISAERYMEDLQLYPRLDGEIPRWLEAKINPNSPRPEISPGTLPEIVARTKAASLQLRLALPQGWNHAQVTFNEVGGYLEASASVQDISGQLTPWSPPVEVSERFSELRAASRGRPAVWYTARVELWYSGEEDFRTFGLGEPQWCSPPPSEAFDEELRRAEGFDYELPDWLTVHR